MKNILLEKVEENTQKEMSKMVSRYFQEHRDAVAKKELTIDKIEEIMQKVMSESDEILKRSMTGAIKASEEDVIEKKKSARTAARSSQNIAQGK